MIGTQKQRTVRRLELAQKILLPNQYRMVLASKKTDMDFPFRNPTGQTTYVFNREFPRGLKYMKNGKQVEGQEVKPTHYIFKDFEGGEYPVSPDSFNKAYTLVRPGIARVKPSKPREFREFGKTNLTHPPLYHANDMIPVGGEYPINRRIFDHTYDILSPPPVQKMTGHSYQTPYPSMSAPK